LAVADKNTFCTCLIAMKPKAKFLDMLSTYDVAKHIHNEFSTWLQLFALCKVSINFDSEINPLLANMISH